MVTLLVALLFTTALAASIWSMWITIQPRLPYIRALLTSGTTPPLAPAPARRVRAMRPAPVSPNALRPLSAAA